MAILERLPPEQLTRYSHAGDARALVAASTSLNPGNRRQTRETRQLKQGWQADAWTYRDAIGELRYAVNFLALCASRMRLYPAIFSTGGETDIPIPLAGADVTKAIPGILPEAEVALAALGKGKLSGAHILKALSPNWTVAGEAFLLGMEDDEGEEEWSIRSGDEIVIMNDKYYLRETPTDPQGVMAWIELKPEEVVLTRMWCPHPRFRRLADAPTRAILEDMESLLIHRRGIRAVGRSRIAGRGILLIPDELSIKVPNEDNQDPESDPFFANLAQVLTAPISDEGVASAVTPAVVRGPAEMLQHVQHIDLAGKYDEESMRIRDELVGIIASGLDLPKEVIQGMADLNHWSAWQVEDNTFRHHIEPHVIELCEALSSAYFRPALEDAGVPPDVARRCVLWYDPTELVTHPDQTKDALELHDRLVISDESLRRTAGFAKDDEPSQSEFLVRLLHNMRNWPPNVVMAAIHALDPTLTIPPMTGPPAIPGVKPTGVDVAEPAPAAPAPEEAQNESGEGGGVAAPPEPTEDTKGPPASPEGAPPFPSVTASAGRSPYASMSAQLMQLDRDLRIGLQASACATVMRALERAGAKIRTKTAKDEALRAKIAHRRNDRVSAYLGQEVVTATGIRDEELVPGDWDDFRSQFLERVAAAQKTAIRIVEREGMRAHISDAAMRRMKDSRQPAWEWLDAKLTELTRRRLYSPDPNKTSTEWGDVNPHTIVPAGILREALHIAGGGNKAVTAAAGVEGGAVQSEPIGQIGTGEAMTEALGEEGVGAVSYRWIHGASLKPFEPHEALNDEVFTSFTDGALSNPGDWPAGDFLMPGDHEGCMCDFETVFECEGGETGETAAGGEEGMCAPAARPDFIPMGKDLPGTPVDEFIRTLGEEQAADAYVLTPKQRSAYARAIRAGRSHEQAMRLAEESK